MPSYVTSPWEFVGYASDEVDEIKSTLKVAPGGFSPTSWVPGPRTL